MAELFNLKIIQYDNGIVEIRKFNTVVNAQYLDMTEEDVKKRDEWSRKEDICREEKIYNPFTEKVENFYTNEQLEILKQREQRSLQVSLNRTKNAIYKYARQCKWEYFITLTFDPSITDSFDYSACMKKANQWFSNQKKRYAPDIQYLYVPEQHESGRWHIHGLLARVGDMQFVDSGHKAKGHIIYNMSGWRFGFSTATSVVDTDKVSFYITKYITKEVCMVTKGKSRYYRSKNIPEPKETNVLIEQCELDNYIDMVADSLGVSKTYEKSVSGYIDVDYKYFK